MSYKDILVYVDESKSCDHRIDAAVRLAQAHEAHLIGLCVAVEARLPAYIRSQLFANVLAQQEQQATERAQALAERFTRKVSGANLSVDCRAERCPEPALPHLISTHARYVDLVVFGQPDPDEVIIGSLDLATEVALSVGRPVLIVPYIGAQATLGERIMVAWDAGRESTRAVNDALPFLERASAVYVLVVGSGADGHGEQPGADLALHLARHGCKAEAQYTVSGEVSVGDTILSRISDNGVDLLVMGAYGHARLREFILGGVTEHMMKHMTVPVLMSH